MKTIQFRITFKASHSDVTMTMLTAMRIMNEKERKQYLKKMTKAKLLEATRIMLYRHGRDRGDDEIEVEWWIDDKAPGLTTAEERSANLGHWFKLAAQVVNALLPEIANRSKMVTE